ncbi:MAG TPA: glycosyltransferase [Ktedonobacterales bacterium]|nr:glycosyltransferase [Ktedonobacterales bacterium]
MQSVGRRCGTAIIIPSIDNRCYLEPCVRSILLYTRGAPYHVYVVNNGASDSCHWIDLPDVSVFQADGNRGWEGGLQLGLDHSSEECVCFLNDDTLLPPSSARWLAHMRALLCGYARVGAVGPSSNYVSGPQSISFLHAAPVLSVRFLIGFCLLTTRAILAEVGGIWADADGADDLDLSIRLRNARYMLLADRTVFLHHHGAATGRRLYGDVWGPNGWYSPARLMRHDTLLRDRHGDAAVDELRELAQPVSWPDTGRAELA